MCKHICKPHEPEHPARAGQKSFHLSPPDKIELKKSCSLSENKKYPTAQPDTTTNIERSIDIGLQTQWTEGQLITAVAVAQLPPKTDKLLWFHFYLMHR